MSCPNLDKINKVRIYVGSDAQASDAMIAAYLDDAADAILLRRYPFGVPDGTVLPREYERLQCRLAARYILRRGAEGEDGHNEDGVNRSYGSVNDEDLLAEVIQIAKVC